jgi:hypothetical protein
MSIFNDLIQTEENFSKLTQWTGSTNTSLTFKDPYQSLLDQNKNFSKNSLDRSRSKWWKFDGKSFRYCLEHRNDAILYTGFDFRGQVLNNSLSAIFFLEGKRKNILMKFESAIDFLIDQVKFIKKQYNFAMDKDYRDFN